MRIESAKPYPHQRLLGAAATLAVHAMVLLGWIIWGQSSAKDDGPEGRRIQWVNVKQPVARLELPRPDPIPPHVMRSKPVAPRVAASAVAPPALATQPAEAPVTEPEAIAPAPEATPARSADDMMQQARRDIGTISRELKKEFPVRGIRAPIDTAQKRLVRGMELAHELAPPKWYERANITELIDPGGQGRRRYRVMTASGPVCWTVDAPHTPNGRDQGKSAGPPKKTNCPPDEEPAKAQEW